MRCTQYSGFGEQGREPRGGGVPRARFRGGRQRPRGSYKGQSRTGVSRGAVHTTRLLRVRSQPLHCRSTHVSGALARLPSLCPWTSCDPRFSYLRDAETYVTDAINGLKRTSAPGPRQSRVSGSYDTNSPPARLPHSRNVPTVAPVSHTCPDPSSSQAPSPPAHHPLVSVSLNISRAQPLVPFARHLPRLRALPGAQTAQWSPMSPLASLRAVLHAAVGDLFQNAHLLVSFILCLHPSEGFLLFKNKHQ